MHPPSFRPSSRPQSESRESSRSTTRPRPSWRPRTSLFSLLPLVASLRPGRREKVSLSPQVRPSPVINFLPDTESSGAPSAAPEASPAEQVQLQQAYRSIPIPGEEVAADYRRWRRTAARLAVLPVVAGAIAGVAFLAGKSYETQRVSLPTRGVATPGLKPASDGGHVRW